LIQFHNNEYRKELEHILRNSVQKTAESVAIALTEDSTKNNIENEKSTKTTKQEQRTQENVEKKPLEQQKQIKEFRNQQVCFFVFSY
jgi:hypothetical protein